MPEIINCPQCARKLRVPEELFGRSVQCPTCGHVFTAPAGSMIPTAVPLAEEVPDVPAEAPAEPLRRPDGPADWSPAERETQPYRPAERPYLQPHRGGLILVLGILSICMCGFLGPVAWAMASSDLRQMRAGRMDPEGQGTTESGRICGIIGTVLMVLGCCCGMPVGISIFRQGVNF